MNKKQLHKEIRETHQGRGFRPMDIKKKLENNIDPKFIPKKRPKKKNL